MKYIALLLIGSSLHAVEPATTISCVAATAPAATTTTTGTMSTSTLMRDMVNKTVFAYNLTHDPIGTAATRVICHGIEASHPYMEKFIGYALEGKASHLIKLKKSLVDKINRWWFIPMRWEKKQIVTIDAILSQPMTMHFEKLRYGSADDVRAVFRNMCELQNRHRMVNFEVKPFSDKDWTHGMKLMRQNPNLSNVYMLDTILAPSAQLATASANIPVQQPTIFKPAVAQGMQHEIIDVLSKNNNHTAVAQQLDTKVKDVISQAQKHNYTVIPELDWRLQCALKALPQAIDAKEFTFHLATVEHLVHDIQVHTAYAAKQEMPLIQRSPELLAQAVTRYFEYLAPTEAEISLTIDLARYVSDLTTGTKYLTAEVRQQRIIHFWNTIDKLSLQNLSKITATQVIDGVAYVAARATYAMGAQATIAVIRNMKNIGAAAAQGAALFAQHFMQIFDSVVAANPAVITNEGAVIWNTSEQVAAEARQLVQAFDGMKDKGLSKPAEILDSGQKVIDKEKEIADTVYKEEYSFTKAAGKHFDDIVKHGKHKGELARPFMNSPLTIKEIIATGKGVPDATAPNALNFQVEGTFMGKKGTWELVVDVERKYIYHFNFKT